MVFIIKAEHFGKNVLLLFVTPKGVPVKMVDAVRTISQLDGAEQGLLLTVATTNENLVGSHQFMQSAFDGHAEDIQRVVSAGNNFGQFVQNIHQLVKAHSSCICMVCPPYWRSMNNTFNITNTESKGKSMINKSLERSFVLNLVEFVVMLLTHMCHASEYNLF